MSGYSQMSAAECPLDSCKDKEKGGVGGALLNSRLTKSISYLIQENEAVHSDCFGWN